jgi:ABC-2 type transport system ATP-binding protein/lipopolysaccharide transport system ATP-binding protein
MCTKALVLSKGESVFFGGVDEGFAFYEGLG